MEDRFKPHAEIPHFERVVLFDALGQHPDALPVIFIEESIIVGIQSCTLQERTLAS